MIDGLPITGEALTLEDLSDLMAETKAHQARILEAIAAFKVRSRSKSVVVPTFPDDPSPSSCSPLDDTAVQRALALANYAASVWSVWLKTDEERRKRTVHPRTQVSPWMMPVDMSLPAIPEFPPSFSSRLFPQPLT